MASESSSRELRLLALQFSSRTSSVQEYSRTDYSFCNIFFEIYKIIELKYRNLVTNLGIFVGNGGELSPNSLFFSRLIIILLFILFQVWSGATMRTSCRASNNCAKEISTWINRLRYSRERALQTSATFGKFGAAKMHRRAECTSKSEDHFPHRTMGNVDQPARRLLRARPRRGAHGVRC